MTRGGAEPPDRLAVLTVRRLLRAGRRTRLRAWLACGLLGAVTAAVALPRGEAAPPDATPATAEHAPPAPPAQPPRAGADSPRRPLALFGLDGGPVSPGPVPRGLSGVEPTDCASCHAEIAAEWAGSAHAQAWTDPVFQAEYRLSPDPFCRHCHAPLVQDEAGPAAPTPAVTPPRLEDADQAALARRGVDCSVCHVREGLVLGAHGHGGDHASRREASLATGAFCGPCHQFNFPQARPGQPVRYHPGQPLQNTLVEWAQSQFADRPCQHCHMPATAATLHAGDTRSTPHRSHAFRTLDDPALLQRAVRVTGSARRRGGTIQIAVQIAPAQIGHAFPTGDMFRQAVLTVRAGAAQRREILRRYFAQTITEDGRGHLLGQVDDTRILGPGTAATSFELALDDAQATEVTWSLELYRLDPAEARDRGLDRAANPVQIQSGTLRIASPATR